MFLKYVLFVNYTAMINILYTYRQNLAKAAKVAMVSYDCRVRP